jgi:4-hydroxybenzoyl-CoA reductase subunit beta
VNLPDFELSGPHTLAEAARALRRRPDARCLAGGTDLLVAMKQGLARPGHLVDLAGVRELQILEQRGSELFVGAAVTLRRLNRHLRESGHQGAVCEAVSAVGSPVLRNMGTLGGNICLDPRCAYYNRSQEWRERQGFCLRHQGSICQAAPRSSRCYAVFSADIPPALIAVGAWVDIYGMKEDALHKRTVPIAALYTGDGARHLTLRADEFVGGVHIPTGDAGTHMLSGYQKCRWRKSIDFPAVGVAVALSLKEGVIVQARVALSGLDSAPLVAREVEDGLTGEKLCPEVFRRVADSVGKGARTVNNHAAGARYRKTMAKRLFLRLCERLCVRAEVDG